MTTGDMDRNGRDEVIMSFSGQGTWAWVNHTSWQQKHFLTASLLATGNVHGVEGDDVVMDFPGHGVFVLTNNATWIQLHGANATSIVAADVDGNGRDDVVIDFPAYGIWSYRTNIGWVPIHHLNAAHVVAGDVDGGGAADLVINFGPAGGIWMLRNGTTWTPLHGLPGEAVALADLDQRPGRNRCRLRSDARALELRQLVRVGVSLSDQSRDHDFGAAALSRPDQLLTSLDATLLFRLPEVREAALDGASGDEAGAGASLTGFTVSNRRHGPLPPSAPNARWTRR
jgi:hypothetical protein